MDTLTTYVELPGGANASSRLKQQLNQFMLANGKRLFEELLTLSGLGKGHWRLRLMKTFARARPLPLLSNFSAQPHHVQCRFKPAGDHGFLVAVVVDKANGETAESLTAKLQHGAEKLCAEHRVEQEVREAFKIQREVGDGTFDLLRIAIEQLDASDPGFADLDEFIESVADEVGPEEDVAFWRQLIGVAEAQGRIFRRGNRYHTSQLPVVREEVDAVALLAGQGGGLAETLSVLYDLSLRDQALEANILTNQAARNEVRAEMRTIISQFDPDLLRKLAEGLKRGV